MREPPYATVLKPYGEALTALARTRPEIVCLGADLTRQTETDLFRDAIPERFFNAGMAEANMIGIAAGLARAGHVVFVNTFGVFCTRRCFDQIAMAVAYPRLNVRLVGFMPGLSSPGGPSHQAIEDVALMRALPNMMVLEPADATEIRQAVVALAGHVGPVYMRLKRGESPLIFEESHRLQLDRAQILAGRGHSDVCLIAAGMMLPAALAAARTLEREGLAVAVINAPVIKPLDGATILAAARESRVIISAENHSIIGGLGSAVAEVLAGAGLGVPLHRVGIADVFAESGSREYLFSRYGLDTQAIVRTAWEALARPGPVPCAPSVPASPGTYAPV
ncbi:MAG TPA: transketolase C-terminal domain-containing protein [Steroidobacteraceae bacterium]|nr:transketolase C-terminal domain-containing protein [Steroidobacteraceae bacterium]